jgi:hypothetical protein
MEESMTMITVRYSSIDHFRKTRKFKTLEGARKFATHYVGENPDMGSSYAVSFDGVGKIEVEGCSLNELFYGTKPTGPLPFEVWSYFVDEQAGTSRAHRDAAFATLHEANQEADRLDEYADGVHLVGTTDDAKAELKAQYDAFTAQLERDREEEPF